METPQKEEKSLHPTEGALLILGILAYAISYWLEESHFSIIGYVLISISIIHRIARGGMHHPQPRKGIEIVEAVAGCAVLSIIVIPIMNELLQPLIIYADHEAWQQEKWENIFLAFMSAALVCIVVSTTVRFANGLPITIRGQRKADERAAQLKHEQQKKGQT